MVVFNFAGLWRETGEGDSLEPIMRAVHVAEDKIHDLLDQSLEMQVFIKFPSSSSQHTLITVYKDSSNVEVTTEFQVDGKWKLSPTNQRLSKCTYSNNTKTLVLEKQVSADLYLRDQRRIERSVETSEVFMRQRLELYNPENKKQSIVAHRRWARDAGESDFDSFLGTWELDDARSQSLEPFLLALHVHKPTFASTCHLQHIHLCGPQELVFISESREHFPPQRSVYSFAARSKQNRIVRAVKTGIPQLVIQIGSAREGRCVHEGEMTQILIHPAATGKVTRYWKRKQEVSWVNSLPVMRPLVKQSTTVAASFSPLQAKIALPIFSIVLLVGFAWFQTWYWLLPHFLLFGLWIQRGLCSVEAKTWMEGWVAIKLGMVILCVVVSSTEKLDDDGGSRYWFVLLMMLGLGGIRLDLFRNVYEKWIAFGVLCLCSTLLVYLPGVETAVVLQALRGLAFRVRLAIANKGMFGYFVNPEPSELDQFLALQLPRVVAQEFSVSVTQVKIVQDGHAEYLIKIQGGDAGEKVEVWRRYRDFHSFRNAMRSKVPFPRKAWSKQLSNAEYLEDRRRKLETFMQTLFAQNGNETLLQDHLVRTFLQLPAI